MNSPQLYHETGEPRPTPALPGITRVSKSDTDSKQGRIARGGRPKLEAGQVFGLRDRKSLPWYPDPWG